MDTLVAQYSQPPCHDASFEEESQELSRPLPPLSLKFDLPAVNSVGLFVIYGYHPLQY